MPAGNRMAAGRSGLIAKTSSAITATRARQARMSAGQSPKSRRPVARTEAGLAVAESDGRTVAVTVLLMASRPVVKNQHAGNRRHAFHLYKTTLKTTLCLRVDLLDNSF